MGRPLNLLVADDDPILLSSLCKLLKDRDDINLVDAVPDGTQVLRVVQGQQVDVALLDVDMPFMDGIATAKMITSRYPHTRVVMFTAFEHDDSLRRSLEAGAKGFLTKDIPIDNIVEYIHRAYAGEIVMGSRPTAMLADSYWKQSRQDDSQFTAVLAVLPQHLVEILDQLIVAASNRVIAEKLGLSSDTVRIYVSRLLQATGCKNRSEVALRAVNSGYVSTKGSVVPRNGR